MDKKDQGEIYRMIKSMISNVRAQNTNALGIISEPPLEPYILSMQLEGNLIAMHHESRP